MTKIFVHGLDSSSKGTKASCFKKHFPEMLIPDFTGSLHERMARLNSILAGKKELLLIGSSFGGLMATIFTLENEQHVNKLILMAPAYNFPEFAKHLTSKSNTPTIIFQGKNDTVTPLDVIGPASQKIFCDLTFHEVDDDHSLHETFKKNHWHQIIC